MMESEIISVDLSGLDDFGHALGDYKGVQVNVFGGIPGETVAARIIEHNGIKIEAVVEDTTIPSPHRRMPPCPLFGECSGCQWQHINYEHQLELKRDLIRRALLAKGLNDSLVLPIVPSPDEFGYRNHARFTVRRRLNRFGFINRITRRFVPVSQCLIMTEGINKLMASLEGQCTETTQFSIRCGINTDEYLIQPKLTNLEVTVTTGQQYYHEVLLGHHFRVSSPSFFQVNTPQAERLALIIIEYLKLNGSETIIDAYAGVATFAALMAPHVKRVIAIEESGAAVKDARENVRNLQNVEILEAKTESVLPHLGKLTDAIIIDPSRNGCHHTTLKTLNLYPPKRLVYVSCDPKTLARDLKVLSRGPYEIESITPVDLFPQTYHVETVSTLSWNSEKEQAFLNRQRLILASASPRRADILTSMGLKFTITESGIAEIPTDGLLPEDQAQAFARAKATAVASKYENGVVITADTIVVLDNELLGKPRSPEEAIGILGRLRGRTHRVVTAVAVTDTATGETIADSCTSQVTMRHYTDEEIQDYVNSGLSTDKAGAYGIQDKEFHPVARIKGCYNNVVGLPVCLMLDILLKLGVHPVISSHWRCQTECPNRNKWGQ
ncbi:septum formation protein Maf [Dehalogenimonas sp. WBC-2]|nr:septum formation protein Maf [Dehalogenimonas sp. WBC-2]